MSSWFACLYNTSCCYIHLYMYTYIKPPFVRSSFNPVFELNIWEFLYSKRVNTKVQCKASFWVQKQEDHNKRERWNGCQSNRLSTNLRVELVGDLEDSSGQAELVCLFLSAGGGGRCAVRQHGGLEEGQRHFEPDQPDRCAETWPSTSAVHGEIASLLTKQTLVGSVGLQESLKRRKEQKHTLANKRRTQAHRH